MTSHSPGALSLLGSTLRKTATQLLKAWTLCRRLFANGAPSASSRRSAGRAGKSFFQRIAGFFADRQPTRRRTAYLALETLEGRIVPTLALNLTSSATPAVYSQSVTLTATLVGYSTLPTGTITFYDGGSSLDTETLASSSDTVTFTTSSLTIADHDLTATYSGDSNNSSVTSSDLTEEVDNADSSTALTSSPNA